MRDRHDHPNCSIPNFFIPYLPCQGPSDVGFLRNALGPPAVALWPMSSSAADTRDTVWGDGRDRDGGTSQGKGEGTRMMKKGQPGPVKANDRTV